MTSPSLTDARRAALFPFENIPLTAEARAAIKVMRDFLESLPAAQVAAEIELAISARKLGYARADCAAEFDKNPANWTGCA